MDTSELVQESLRILDRKIDYKNAGVGDDPLSPDLKLPWPAAFALHASAEAQRFEFRKEAEAESNAVLSVLNLVQMATEPDFRGWGIPVPRDSMRVGQPHPKETALALSSAYAIIAICDVYPLLDPSEKITAVSAVRKTIKGFLAAKRDTPNGSSYLLFSSDPSRIWAVTNTNALFAGALHKAATRLPIATSELVECSERIAKWVVGALRERGGACIHIGATINNLHLRTDLLSSRMICYMRAWCGLVLPGCENIGKW